MNQVRRGVAGDAFFQRSEQVFRRGGLLEGVGGVAGEFVRGVFLQPFRAVLRLDGEQFVEIDGEGRGDFALVLALAGERDGAPAGDLQFEAHDGLIDAADFLDIERAVGEALAVEEHELFQDAVESAVADKGQR